MRFRSILLLAIFAVMVPILSFAQTGSITGTVTDSAGAVVPHAKVTVSDEATGATRSVTTSETGAYSVTTLAVGNYDVTVENKGFRTAKVVGVNVTVAQVVPVNVKLVVGAVSEVVELNGQEVAQVDTETSQVSSIVDNQKIEALPMITRDPYSLVLLAPGTTQSNSGLGGFSVNGSRERNNNFTLDGTDNNDTSVPGIPGGLSSISPEATQEFRVITNNFMPEFGRNTGAIVDIVSKSGTNSLHGEGHWFGRYAALGARDAFNSADWGTPEKNPYVRNIFGYSLGGPIKKDKTFFFFNNEFQRFRTTLASSAVVPNDSLKNGVLTYTDPNTGEPATVDFNNPGDLNNFTGISGIDPAISKVLALYPQANGGAVDENTSLYYFPSPSKYNSVYMTGKIDHRVTTNNQLSLRYVYNKSDDPGAFHDEFLPGYGGTSWNGNSHNVTADFTSTLNNRLINDFRVGFNRADSAFACGGLDKINILGKDTLGRGQDLNLPGISGFGCFPLGDSDGQARRTGTWSFSDSLTYVKGAHTMKFGGDFRFVYDNGFDDFSSRELLGFSTSSNWGVPSFISSAFPAADVADWWNNPSSQWGPGAIAVQDWLDQIPSGTQNMGWMLTGSVDSQGQSQYFNKAGDRMAMDNRRFRQREYSTFFQDAWKVRSNLTLNLGARYAFNGVPYETDGNMSNLFVDPSGAAPFTFSLVGPGTNRLLYNNDYSMFEPRVGFAWDVFNDGKTAVRGGFGIFHDRVFGNLFGNAKANPPFQADYLDYPVYNYFLGGAPQFVSTIPIVPEQTSSATVQDGAGIYPVIIDPNLKMPRSYNWNLGIQRQLTPTMSLDVAWVGSQADRILREVDGNAPDPAKIAEALAAGVNPNLMVGSSIWFKTFSGISLVNNSAFYQAAVTKSMAKSVYNSLQTKLSKKMSHGIQANLSYTWAHGGDNASDPLVAAAGNRSFPRNSHNLNAEWGNSDFDMRHRVVLDYTLELPFGKGTARLANGFVGRALEGWSLSGVTSWQTGHPYEVFGNRDSQHQGLSDRAYLIGDPNAPVTVDPSVGIFTGLNLAAFSNAPWNSASNLGRNIFYGPHYSNFNMVASKKMKFGERFSTELRIEAYNVFNHVNLTQPDNAIADTNTFGYSTSQIGNSDGTTGARQLQVGLKLSF